MVEASRGGDSSSIAGRVTGRRLDVYDDWVEAERNSESPTRTCRIRKQVQILQEVSIQRQLKSARDNLVEAKATR